MLTDQIQEVVALSLCPEEVSWEFLDRLAEGNLTRDENAASHFCLYFLPYNPKTKEIFIVHHKKSGLWISPGGHIDRGESLLQALEREIGEELGVTYHASLGLKPFLLTITPIEREVHACKTHYDIWYPIPTDGSDFEIDPREFYETRWLTIDEARTLVTDPPNLEALAKIEKKFAEAHAV